MSQPPNKKGGTDSYKWVTINTDRHGKIRYRFRRRGYPSAYLPGPLGSKNFLTAYSAAIKALPIPKKTHVKAKSMKALVISYYQSNEFERLRLSTQTAYSGILERFVETYGHLPVAKLTRPNIIKLMQARKETPNAANGLLKMLKIVLAHAQDMGWIERNPAEGIRKLKTPKGGFTPWTLEEIQKYLNYHRSNEMAYLAMMLLFYTDQRSSDVARLGCRHRQGDYLHFTQQKTGKEMALYIPRPLAALLDKYEVKETYLTTQYGKPFSIKGFQQWFVRKAREAGIEAKSSHGVRKATPAALFNSGVSTKMAQAVTGHDSLAELEKYSKSTDQKRLSKAAWETANVSNLPK